MPDESPPEDVRNFVLQHIDSVAQLEALLLLWGNPGEVWDVPRIAKRLYIGDQETADILAWLCDQKLISCAQGIYHADATDHDLQQIVASVADSYGRNLIAITNMIHAKPRGIRQFSDAFKFRRNS